jgi:hypothetical protein
MVALSGVGRRETLDGVLFVVHAKAKKVGRTASANL